MGRSLIGGSITCGGLGFFARCFGGSCMGRSLIGGSIFDATSSIIPGVASFTGITLSDFVDGKGLEEIG